MQGSKRHVFLCVAGIMRQINDFDQERVQCKGFCLPMTEQRASYRVYDSGLVRMYIMVDPLSAFKAIGKLKAIYVPQILCSMNKL